MDKESIRKLVLARRNALSLHDVREKSKLIQENLFLQTEFIQASTVCLYIAFGNEVSTKEIIEECYKYNKKVVVPVMFGDNDLEAAEFLGFDKLKPVLFGIQEPFPVKPVKIDEINLVIAPGVAFDEKLNRIGFGKGYYDKFLAKLSKGIPIIALAFEMQVLKEVPSYETDIKMNKIITEKRMIE